MIDKENTGQFVMIPCALRDDPRLKPNDVYIMSYLLSCKKEWIVRQEYVAKRCRLGMPTVKGSFKRLKAAGYAEYRQARAAGGEWGEGDWVIHAKSRIPIDAASVEAPMEIEEEGGWTIG